MLLRLQHAFEMLLKAALVQRRQNEFDKKTQRSIGFAKCVNVGDEAPLSLTSEETGPRGRSMNSGIRNSTGSPSSMRSGCTYTPARG